MRVAIITDYLLSDWLGGAQLSDDYLCRRMREAGLAASLVPINTAHNSWPADGIDQFDFFVLTNIHQTPVDIILSIVRSGKPYFTVRHDISANCYRDDPATAPFNAYLSEIFSRSQCNFFISPIQHSYYQRVCQTGTACVVPPPMDLSAFASVTPTQGQGCLYLGEISRLRGVPESFALMQSQYPGLPMRFAGQVSDAALMEDIQRQGGEYLGVLNRAQVLEQLQAHSVFFYHPNIVDAFCLKVVEAELCGLEVVANRNNIGRYYYSASAPELVDFMRTESVGAIVNRMR